MNVLFISSGNSDKGISTLVYNQGESLINAGNIVMYYTIKGKGVYGYLRNIPTIRKIVRENNYDIVHAHNIFCGFAAAIARVRPLVVSLMGWNVRKPTLKTLIRFFNFYFWDVCIVKSNSMKDDLGIRDLVVVPNGINLLLFTQLDKEESKKKCGWDLNKKHILFAADPDNPIKNYSLAKKAYELLENSQIELHGLGNVEHNDVVFYFNAADVVLFTSLGEGSPNVIKEAMACNAVIVSTRVGDVVERLEGIDGCYLCEYDAYDVSINIRRALAYKKSTNARERILTLDEGLVAQEIMSHYNRICCPHKNRRR